MPINSVSCIVLIEINPLKIRSKIIMLAVIQEIQKYDQLHKKSYWDLQSFQLGKASQQGKNQLKSSHIWEIKNQTKGTNARTQGMVNHISLQKISSVK
jgi:hypothetical protein